MIQFNGKNWKSQESLQKFLYYEFANNLEESQEMFLELLGHHPDAKRKIGKGVDHFYKDYHKDGRKYQGYGRMIPCLKRVDGTSDDFSIRKCIANIPQSVFKTFKDSRRFVPIKHLYRDNAKCCDCHTGITESDYVNPNPNAIKKFICSPCYERRLMHEAEERRLLAV